MNRTPKPSEAEARELLGLLLRQVQLYDELTALARRQRRLIAEEDTSPLLKLLAQRQKLTAELTELNGRMTPLRAQWDEVRDSLAPEDRQRARTLVSQVNERLAALLATDEEDARMLSIRKQRVGTELEKVRCTKRAVSAYGVSSEADVAHFDQTHEES